MIASLLPLAIAIQRMRRVSDTGCGALIMNRYSLPSFLLISGPISVGVLLIAAAFLLNEAQVKMWFGRLMLVGFGLGVGLFATEVYLRITHPLPSVEDVTLLPNEVLGYTYKPYRTVIELPRGSTEYRNEFSTDENGLIIRDENPNQLDPEARRILFIGDSFVAGMQVPVMENMSEVLEDQAAEASGQRIQATNVGMLGYDPVTYLLSYDYYKDQFDPEIVIVALYLGNDLTTVPRRFMTDMVILDEYDEPVAVRPTVDLEHYRQWNQFTKRWEPMEVRENTLTQEAAISRFIKQQVVVPFCIEREAKMLAQQVPVTPVGSEDNGAGSTTSQPQALPPWWDKCAGLEDRVRSQCFNYKLRNDSLIRNNAAAVYKDEYTDLDLEDLHYSTWLLSLLASEVETDGRQFILVIIPPKAQVPDQAGYAYIDWLEDDIFENRRPQDFFMAFCEEQELTCIDMLPVLQAHSDEKLYWRTDSHMTPLGHRITAKTILPYVLDLLR